MQKLLILIGGTAGTGKTSLARKVSSRLSIDHRLGTGFVREIVKPQTNDKEEPSLYTFTFQATDPIQNLIKQSQRLYKPIKACIERARNEGTSLVIEGTHLIPTIYHNEKVDLYIILAAPEVTEHHKRITGASHSLRSISVQDFENVRIIDRYLEDESRSYGIPYFVAMNDLDELLALIRERL